jgi:hypothetical protein
VPIEFEPRRRRTSTRFSSRQTTRAGRLLAPQLRPLAGDIPTFATSDIYDPGNAAGDNDLNGLIFADAPVPITPSVSADDLRHDVQS